jgi:uncharacterized membrane protein YbhN (UPF0104 family)
VTERAIRRGQALEPARRKRAVRRALAWTLSLVALAFVAWVIPLRDRCWDPRSPASTRVAVSRQPAGCVLHVPSGDVDIDPDACARLACEPGLVSTLTRARLSVVVAMLALYAFGTLAWAARWRALLAFAGVTLSTSRVWRISIEAQAGGILLPGGIGGDALRVASVVSRAPRTAGAARPWAIVVASVLLDRAVGLAVLSGLAAALGIAFRTPSAGGDALVAVLLAVPAAFLFALVLVRRASGRLPAGRLGERLQRAAGPVLAYIRDPRAPRAIATAAALSLVVAAVQFATIRGLVFALGATPREEKWVYVGAAMAFIVGAIPALPGGWGTADAAYIFFFGLAGLLPGVALAVCLLYRLFWYLCGAVGAILHATGGGPSAGIGRADSADKT